MNHRSDTTTSADNGGNFDPQQAAALLDQTTQRARRKFEPYPPWLLVLRAVGVLAALGTVWLSVRGQHPYQHPTAAVIPVVVTFGVLNLVATVTVARRATAGVSGRTRRALGRDHRHGGGMDRPVRGHGGAGWCRPGDAIVYGLYPTAVPLIVFGLAWAGVMACRADWRACGTGLAVAVVGAVAVAAGPADAWAVAGVGLCVTLLGKPPPLSGDSAHDGVP